MRKLFKLIIFLLVCYLLITYSKQISKFVMVNMVFHDNLEITSDNGYSRKIDWNYVQTTTDFEPKKKQDILNIIYTTLDRGYDDVTFYCDINYDECIDEAYELLESEDNAISHINEFIPTYNSFHHIVLNSNSIGRINLQISKIYDNEKINKINEKINEIYSNIVKDNMTDYEKIKVVHDYIINNTSYDDERAEQIKNNNIDVTSDSSTAYGVLFNKKAICSGYTDTMALFLDKMGIKNLKIVGSNHIWNAVYLDGKWFHLDLTWDDPTFEDSDYSTITYDYFLISDEELKSKNEQQHKYNEKFYTELKS